MPPMRATSACTIEHAEAQVVGNWPIEYSDSPTAIGRWRGRSQPHMAGQSGSGRRSQARKNARRRHRFGRAVKH
jgi:hypothetical protein